MNLLRNNNLYDVYDVCCARGNLLMKSSALLNYDNANLEGKYITIDTLKLTNFVNYSDTFIKCDSVGNVFLDTDFTIPKWLRAETSDIDVRVFNNDIGIVSYDELHSIAFNGDFTILSNTPTLEEYIQNEKQNVFCVKTSNLEDCSLFQYEILSVLSLNEYATCNLQNTMEFNNLNIQELTFENILNKNGILDTTYNVLTLAKIPNASGTNYGKGLLKSNPNLSTDIVSSSFLNEKFNDLYNIYSSKNEEYEATVAFVNNYILRNIDTFVSKNEYLGDMDAIEMLKNLELDKMMNKVIITETNVGVEDSTIEFQSSIDMICDGSACHTMEYILENSIDINFTDLVIHFNSYSSDASYELVFEPLITTMNDKYGSKVRTTNYRGLYDYELLFLHYIPDDNPYVRLEDMDTTFHRVTDTEFNVIHGENEKGIIHLFGDFETYCNNTSNTFPIQLFENIDLIYERQFEGLNDIMKFQDFLETLFVSGEDNGSNLLRFTCNLSEIRDVPFEQKLLCYSNLQIEVVAYTNEYYDLFHIPISLRCFSNDVLSQFMSAYNNLSEYATDIQKEICRTSLNVGTIGTQNIENVDIYGDEMTMDFVRGYSTLYYEHDYDHDVYFKASDNVGNVVLSKLTEYSDSLKNIKGVVKMYDTLVYDREGTYNTQLLNDVYVEIHNSIALSTSNLDHIMDIYEQRLLTQQI